MSFCGPTGSSSSVILWSWPNSLRRSPSDPMISRKRQTTLNHGSESTSFPGHNSPARPRSPSCSTLPGNDVPRTAICLHDRRDYPMRGDATGGVWVRRSSASRPRRGAAPRSARQMHTGGDRLRIIVDLSMTSGRSLFVASISGHPDKVVEPQRGGSSPPNMAVMGTGRSDIEQSGEETTDGGEQGNHHRRSAARAGRA